MILFAKAVLNTHRWNINNLRVRNPDEKLQSIIDMMVIGPADVENVDVEEILGVRAEESLRSKFRDRRNGQSNKIGECENGGFEIERISKVSTFSNLITAFASPQSINKIWTVRRRTGTRRGRGSTAPWPTPTTTARCARKRRSAGCRDEICFGGCFW